MKNLFKSFVAVTAAAMAFVGCVKEQPLAPQNNEETQTIKLVFDNQQMNLTKTQMNQDGTDVIWSADQKASFYLDNAFDYNKPATAVVNGRYLEVSINTTKKPTVIDGFIGGSFNKDTQVEVNKKVTAFGINLPMSQKVTTTSFDPLADVLVMETQTLGADLSKPITGINYHRLHAITKLSFRGLDEHSTENVVSVEFTTKNADLSGAFTYDYVNKKFVDLNNTDVTGSIFTANASKSVIMTYPDNTPLDQNFAAWMVTAAQTLKKDEVVTITITTDKNIIKGSFTLPANKEFKSTQLNTLALNMAGVTATPVETVNVEPGDYVILYKDSQNKYQALSSNVGKYNVEPVAVTYNGTDTEFSTGDTKIIFTISKDANGDYAFKNNRNNQYLMQKAPNKGHINSSFASSPHYFEIFKNNGKFGIRTNGNTLNLSSKSEFTFESATDLSMTECLILPLKKTPILTFATTTFTALSTDTSLKIHFDRNKDAIGNVNVEVISGSDWLTVNPTTISGSVSEINCSFSANTDAERTAKLKVTHANAAEQIITVNQTAFGVTAQDIVITWPDLMKAGGWANKASMEGSTVTIQGFTFKFLNASKAYTEEMRFYSKNQMTISHSSKKISKVVLNDGSNADYNGTPVASITIKNPNSSQIKVKEITITVE